MSHSFIKKSKTPYLIGITGSFGVGKSTVGNILTREGVYVIDTDEIVRRILRTKNNITVKVVEIFGKEILNSEKDEYVDRRKLAKVVFSDKVKRKNLESLIHPEVINNLKGLISGNTQNNVIAVLVPLLFEAKLKGLFDEIWCVTCDSSVLFKRVLNKGYTKEEAQKRINTQLSQEEKACLSDYIIDNSGNLNDTNKQVVNLLEKLDKNIK